MENAIVAFQTPGTSGIFVGAGVGVKVAVGIRVAAGVEV
jgi:hypothetical protein